MLLLRKDLTPIKTKALAQIDEQAEVARRSPSPGQANVYAQKLAQARAYLSGADQDFQFLENEIGITGETLEQVSRAIVEADGEWIAHASTIEKLRLAAKKAVREAVTPAEIEAALQIDWSSSTQVD